LLDHPPQEEKQQPRVTSSRGYRGREVFYVDSRDHNIFTGEAYDGPTRTERYAQSAGSAAGVSTARLSEQHAYQSKRAKPFVDVPAAQSHLHGVNTIVTSPRGPYSWRENKAKCQVCNTRVWPACKDMVLMTYLCCGLQTRNTSDSVWAVLQGQ